jgi:uncharacterized protein (DUF1800 family)
MLLHSSRRASTFRSTVAIALLFIPQLPIQLLTIQQLPAEPPSLKSTPASPNSDQAILHLLNRFTFGATPDSIAAVRTLGMDAWFDQQLHPNKNPTRDQDQQLNNRLAQFPALQLPVDQLMRRFPSGAAIRRAASGKRDIPNDPYLAAIYRRHIALYEEKQAAKAETQAQAKENSNASGPPKPEMKPESTAPTESITPPDPNRPAYDDLLVKSVLALPTSQRINRIFEMQPAEFEQFKSALKGPRKADLTQDLTPAQRELLEDYEAPTRTVIQELQAQRLLRDIYSPHQLQEVMTTFWLNHFNVYLHKNEETPYYLVSYERDVIRPRALGNFEDLLIATAQSPAMLIYLDNSASTGPESVAAEKQKQRAAQGKNPKNTKAGLNENYARELMELHTLGVNGGYTQKDVTEVAKVFTGWTVDKPQQGGGFEFDPTRHEPGRKLVLGRKIKENGQKEGLQLLHMLATRPATAHFISQELAVAFVSDTPPSALVDRMAKSFLATHGDIATVLATMMHSPEFWSPSAYQAKVKTPLEYVVSAARASGAEITNAQPLVNALNQMGMPLYACVPPTGYAAKADEWVSTGALVTRMNFALSLATNHYGGVRTDWTSVNPTETDPHVSEQVLESRLIPTGVSDQTRTAVLNQAATQTPAPSPSTIQPVAPLHTQVAAKPMNPAAQAAALEKQNEQLAGLLLGSPEFQRR